MSEVKQSGAANIKVLESIILRNSDTANATVGEDEIDNLDRTTDISAELAEYEADGVERVISSASNEKIMFAEDIANPEPISPAHAVLSTNVDMDSFHDEDDDSKIILTLETTSFISKSEVNDPLSDDELGDLKQTEQDISSLEIHTMEEQSKLVDGDSPGSVEISEIARLQLQALASKKRGDKPRISEQLSLNAKLAQRKQQRLTGHLVKEEPEKPKKITSIPPSKKAFIENNNSKASLRKGSNDIVKNDDLIAILEGPDTDNNKSNDDEKEEESEEIEVITVTENCEPIDEIPELMKERVKKESTIQRGNPIKKRATKLSTVKTNQAGSKVNVTSLVSEWSDSEKDTSSNIHDNEEKSLVKKEKPDSETASESKPIQPIIVPFKRSRIIKKKIIWDPDAPETQFSYASLVSSSAKKSTTPKRLVKVDTIKKVEPKLVTKEKEEPKVRIINAVKRRPETPPTLQKKKKLNEVNQLINDEQIIGILDELENDKPVQKNVPKDDEVEAGPSKQIKKEPTGRKRGPKPAGGAQSAAASWDYVYNKNNEDSLIIRRRSNSSYSSTSPRRLSLDHPQQSPAATRNTSTRGKFEFAKPGNKKATASTPVTVKTPVGRQNSAVAKVEVKDVTRRSSRVISATVEQQREPPKVLPNNDITLVSVPVKMAISAVMVKKHADVVQIMFKPKTEKPFCTLTAQIMTDIINHLEILQKDTSCKVVVLTSIGVHFCQGIDYGGLIQANADKRKSAAQEMANSLRNFLMALASFPKPLVAGISGNCSGLGVMMLPLFDVIISSDKSIFEAPYPKFGQLPEGYTIISLNHNIRHNFKTKLLILCEKVNTSEASLSGLVTKVVQQGRVHDETLECAKRIALFSQQTYMSMKLQRQKAELSKISAGLLDEQKVLIQHWCSIECQERFKHILAKDIL